MISKDMRISVSLALGEDGLNRHNLSPTCRTLDALIRCAQIITYRKLIYILLFDRRA
jgi:hypothetical protein